MSERKVRVAIIGSGFGGLSLGARLQSQGYDVTIYEKQDMVGGHAYQLKDRGYTFDLGPSLITAPSIIREIFETAGREMDDYLDLIPLDPFYRIYYHDGTFLDYSGDPELMKQEIAKFSEEDAARYDDFMKYSKRLYEIVIKEKLGARPFLGYADFVRAFPEIVKNQAFFSAFKRTSDFFKHPKIQFAFSFHPLFIGGNPFNAPALYLMIPYLEREEGVWFTKGGMYTLVQALEKLFTEFGGGIRLETEVEKISVGDNGKAEGVITNAGEFEAYDLVVSNAHVYHTYSELIDADHRKFWTDKRLESKDYSMSSFLLYIGTDRQFPELLHHTLILSERYKGLVQEIFAESEIPEDFSMYLHAPTRTDPSMAPAGGESMYVLVPTPNLAANIDWDDYTDEYTEKILSFLEEDFGMKGLKDSIQVIHKFTPEDFRDKRNNYLGSAWGLQPKLFQSANFRAHNRSEDISNLYLVGASTHPGAGVPGVMLTAETTEKLIKADYPVKN